MMKRLFFFGVAFVFILSFMGKGAAKAAEPIKIGFMGPLRGGFCRSWATT